MITYRQMSVEDIPFGLSLCRYAGWNQLASDWELFLQLNSQGCRVAVDDNGKVVGTVTSMTYQKHFSWIGMVLVDPEVRRLGIGTKLLQEALHILKNEETIKLDATPVGREVYLPLTFVDEYPLSRMQIASVEREALTHSDAVIMKREDLYQLSAFDQKVFGADRSSILEHLLRKAPHLALVTRENNNINGYCFGRRGYNYTHIGPLIANNVKNAVTLISSALQGIEGPVIIDVPPHSQEWNTWLSSIGFTEQRPFMRMYRGTNHSPGIPEKQFAILGPEFG